MLNAMLIRTTCLRSARHAITQYMLTFAPGYRPNWSSDTGVEMCLRPLTCDSDLQRAIDHCLFAANARHLRHIDNVVYEPIFVNGKLIKAYRPLCTMMDFVINLKQSVFSEAHKILSASKNLIKSVVEDLTIGDYHLFPKHHPNNEWIAFNDGLLHIWTAVSGVLYISLLL